MLLARMDDAVNRYVKANQIPPTPQFEPLDTFRVHKESEAHRLKKVMGIIGKMHRVRYEQRRDLTYSDTVVHLFVLGPDMQKVRAKLRGLVK